MKIVNYKSYLESLFGWKSSKDLVQCVECGSSYVPANSKDSSPIPGDKTLVHLCSESCFSTYYNRNKNKK